MAAFSLGRNIKSIEDLRGERFVVAEYQRGYRWKAGRTGEVVQLLKDVQRFRPRRVGDFYCLQPLVISPRRNESAKWELIDGQQRLTTIFLILAYLKFEAFELSYLTRPGSSPFLQRIRAGEIDPGISWEAHSTNYPGEDNIENSYFFAAWQSITEWFAKPEQQAPGATENFAQKLRHATGFIWYETPEPDHKKVFLNLNSGKIPLTNSELVKALFLRSDLPADAQAPLTYLQRAEIAAEWDRIESKLQSPEFWFFLNKKEAVQGTRIDFLFESLLPTQQGDADDLRIYRHYADVAPLDVMQEWKKIKTSFLTMLGWFEDRALYHDIGYLTACGESIAALYQESRKMTKTPFTQWIVGQVKRQVRGCDCLKMRYKPDRARLGRVLLLFNIRVLASNPNAGRFPFHRYHGTEWSLEHIHAQNSKTLASSAEWKEWVYDVTAVLKLTDNEMESRPLVAELTASLELADDAAHTQSKRDALEAQVLDFFGPDFGEGEMDRIDNLALLSGSMNSSLSNNLFPVKRSEIISWDKRGDFIPPATKNVFLKYYGGDVARMNKWTKQDRGNYLAEIAGTLAAYLA